MNSASNVENGLERDAVWPCRHVGLGKSPYTEYGIRFNEAKEAATV